MSAQWLNLDWSDWSPIEAVVSGTRGVYRVRRPGADDLPYIGEGLIRRRLVSHLRKTMQAAHRRGEFFDAPERLEAPYVVMDRLLDHQLLEIECDLIASHLLLVGRPPPAQFLG
jgi:hypothetical protein